MAIINQRWPRDIRPEICSFGRTRNDIRQTSPRTRQASVIKLGRPLWSAECSWSLGNTEKLAKLRYWLEALEGYNGSAQIWDFASPFPWGLNLATSGVETTRWFWSYLSTRSPFTYAGLPAYWEADSMLTLPGAHAAGATSINLTGLSAGGLVCVQGQYVQIGRRLYLCADTVTANGSGAATVPIVPGLAVAAAAGTEVRFAEAACEMQLAEQNFDSRSRAGEGLTVVSAKFIESVTDVT